MLIGYAGIPRQKLYGMDDPGAWQRIVYNRPDSSSAAAASACMEYRRCPISPAFMVLLPTALE